MMINRSKKKNESRVHLNLIKKRRKRWKKIERSCMRQREKREREKDREKTK